MPKMVATGAMMSCTQGTAPASFTATKGTTQATTDAGTIVDTAPNVNIAPFAMCISLANPTVASATSAALGVLTPQPCIPAVAAPWTPGATTTTIDKKPALHDGCTAMCNWAGTISFSFAGQVIVDVK